MTDGQKLLAQLAALSPQPVYIRTHNLLTSGDGTPALKWGSTGVYSEDDQGRPRYDWTILDRIFDTYRERGVRPYVQIGFMPEALSTHPVAVSARLDAGRPGVDLHRLGLSAQGLREVGRAGLPVGAALGRAIRPGRGRDLVLGGLERAEHHLLAGHARGVPQALRPRRRRREAGAAHGQGRRPARRRGHVARVGQVPP